MQQPIQKSYEGATNLSVRKYIFTRGVVTRHERNLETAVASRRNAVQEYNALNQDLGAAQDTGLEHQRKVTQLNTEIANLKRLLELLSKQRDEEVSDDKEYLEQLRSEKAELDEALRKLREDLNKAD